MDTETMIRELECVEEKHKHDEVFTGQLNIAEMVHDVRKRLEELKPYEDTGLTPERIREMQELLSRENGKETTNSGWSGRNDMIEKERIARSVEENENEN